MPRDRKFTMGDRLLARGMLLLETVVEAYYLPRHIKKPKIAEANVHCEIIRQLLRLLFEKGIHISGKTMAVSPIKNNITGRFSMKGWFVSMKSGFVIFGIVVASLLIWGCGSKSSPTGTGGGNTLSAPTLSSPSNGATSQATSPTLMWEAVTGATAYDVRVSTVATFASTISSQTGLAARSASVVGLANSTNYYWEVNATNADSTSAWSSSWHFTTLAASAVSPTMISIPAGTFQMGSTNANLYASPVHSVTLGAFTMSKTLVTQAQYQAVMGLNPSYFDSGSTWPVESVNWYDAAWFCNKLSKLAGLDTVYTYTGVYQGSGYDTLTSVAINYAKNGYRLPTEAEYEYANRAGTTTDYYWGRNYPPTTTADTLAIDSNAVWYYNSPNGTQPVATKKPNAWGLYDMSGNVWEWCNDWYGNYSATSQTNPTGATTGSSRVLRGGSWVNNGGAYVLCAAYRNGDGPEYVSYYYRSGFRVVCGAR